MRFVLATFMFCVACSEPVATEVRPTSYRTCLMQTLKMNDAAAMAFAKEEICRELYPKQTASFDSLLPSGTFYWNDGSACYEMSVLVDGRLEDSFCGAGSRLEVARSGRLWLTCKEPAGKPSSVYVVTEGEKGHLNLRASDHDAVMYRWLAACQLAVNAALGSVKDGG